MNTSTTRQEYYYSNNVLYTMYRTIDRRRTDIVVICWLPKFHDFKTRSSEEEGVRVRYIDYTESGENHGTIIDSRPGFVTPLYSSVG